MAKQSDRPDKVYTDDDLRKIVAQCDNWKAMPPSRFMTKDIILDLLQARRRVRAMGGADGGGNNAA